MWEASPDAFIFLGEASHLGKLDLGLETEVVELITLVGVVDLNGVSVYYLSGALPADAAADLVGDSSLENEAYDAPVETEMWIGVEDSLVRKLGVRFKQTDAISGTSLAGQTIMTFSDYGKAVDIQAPELEEQDVTVGTGEDDHGDTLASQITWTAPDSGEYFIAVESFDVDAVGTYTLTVTVVNPAISSLPA